MTPFEVKDLDTVRAQPLMCSDTPATAKNLVPQKNGTLNAPRLRSGLRGYWTEERKRKAQGTALA